MPLFIGLCVSQDKHRPALASARPSDPNTTSPPCAQLYTVDGKLSYGAGEGALPPSLEFLSMIHATPLQLPACLARLPVLKRVFVSECSFEEGAFPGPLLHATALQVGATLPCPELRLSVWALVWAAGAEELSWLWP
jgi:hypothetical protein